MKKIFRGLGIGLVSAALVAGAGAVQAFAATTFAVNAITETGALTISSSSATSALVLGTSSMTTGTTTIYGGTGTGAITLTPGTAGTIVVGAAAGTGLITIGASTAAEEVDIATGNAAKTVLIGNATAGGASVTTIHAGTGGLNLATTADARTISIGTGAAVQTINIGTGAAANVITIGAANTTASVSIKAGSGGILLGGGTAAPTTVNGAFNYILDTGAADVYVATFVPAFTAYTTGMEIHMKVANVNATTTPTVNVNGLGAKTIVKRAATALAAGDMPAGSIAVMIYDGTNFELINPVVN